MPENYRDTLNLPQTTFPMKADLIKREPEVLKKWEETHLYSAILKKNESGPKFILHDGPPYANGSIHFGHILNKVLKDIIIKYKNMSGAYSPYIPGWDCHGLPIEHQVDKDLGSKKKSMTKTDIRRACRDYAMKFVALQREDFKRLGVFGDWENPYLTMNYPYEAQIAREFGRFVAQGDIYKGLRPVLWCSHCRTALADAEVEYEEHESPSVYVKFPITSSLKELFPKLPDLSKKVSIVIWTTTPWTLPANLAVALHESYDYVVIPYQDEYLIVAKQLLSVFCKAMGLEKEPEPLERFSGKKLEKKQAQHPFLPRPSLIVLSSHVTLDTGTGCVHIAPGHGEEDHEVGLRYQLAILTPVDSAGRFTSEAGIAEWTGLKVLESNLLVIEKLKSTSSLLKEEKIRHMYPHCWRCKKPLIFRATAQWFLSLSKNDLKTKALDAIRRVQWIPHWGRDRIYGMVENRPDWCLSRQRSWGVPIIAFRCGSCDHLLLDANRIQNMANRFEKEGSDIWFSETPETLLPAGTQCEKCHATQWIKEEDILDVWFDSGVSFAAVLEKNKDLNFPADLYLEGSDQHRGWFHASLLASVGTRGKAPYQSVLTHGFVVDSQGKKYSKSVGNYIPPEKVLKENGAEILRLWVAAEDYRNDIRVSPEILTRLVEAYRKIRNTCRFLLGNLYDYDPSSPLKESDYLEIDLFSLHHLQKLIIRTQKAYEEFNFHMIFHDLNRFCTVDLSAFYCDILKDRLYTSAKNDPHRKAAQKVLFEIVTVLAKLMAPILSFTAEEIWQHIPNFPGKESSIHLTNLPKPQETFLNESLASRWEKFRTLRNEILKALERARQEKIIGNSLEAKLIFTAADEPLTLLESFKDQLPTLFQVSQVQWSDDISPAAKPSEQYPSLFIEVQKAEGQKCERCWKWSTEVGKHTDHPQLCGTCHHILTL